MVSAPNCCGCGAEGGAGDLAVRRVTQRVSMQLGRGWRTRAVCGFGVFGRDHERSSGLGRERGCSQRCLRRRNDYEESMSARSSKIQREQNHSPRELCGWGDVTGTDTAASSTTEETIEGAELREIYPSVTQILKICEDVK